MSKHITLAQLSTVVNGMAAKDDARFSKIADIQNSVTSTETAKPASAAAVKQAYDLAYGKQDPATSISGYGITDAYTKTEVDNAISEVQAGALKPGGTLHAAGIVSGLLVLGNLGKVYNVDEDFTTTADFVEGAGKALPAGTNIYVVDVDTTGSSPSYKFDVLSGSYGVATQSGNGLMSSTDKTKLDNADVTAYTAGNGIDITSHAVAVTVDSSNARGLSVGANGIALAAAEASTSGVGGSAGAMSATDKEKLDNADVTAYTGTGAIDITSHVISIAAASPSTSGVGGAAGTMSAADKEKLDSYTEATDQEVQAILDGVWPTT